MLVEIEVVVKFTLLAKKVIIMQLLQLTVVKLFQLTQERKESKSLIFKQQKVLRLIKRYQLV